MTEPRLTILDGVQAGSQLPLLRGSSRVGTGLDCAIVIADPVMQQDHFELIVGETTSLRVVRPLTLEDGTLLAAGSELPVSGTMTFKAGGTSFLIESPGQAAAAMPDKRAVARSDGRRTVALSIGGLVAVGAMVCFGFPRGVAPVRPAVAGSVALSRLPRMQPDANAATDALQRRLNASGLNDLSATARPDGTVVVSGLLSPGRQSDWNDVREWYDGHFGNGAVIVEHFTPTGLLPPLRIAAVWSGDNPYVVDDHGNRLHPGAALDDGWLVDRIDQSHVVVRRGAQIVALRY